jgi:hypothetical protein
MKSDIFLCPDCEQVYVDKPDSMCAACTQWRVDKLTSIDHEYEAWRHREESRRMSPGARFGEALADMAKAVERSKR